MKRVALLVSFAAGSSGLVVGAVAVVVTGCTAIDHYAPRGT
jgi:hypothetical protein